MKVGEEWRLKNSDSPEDLDIRLIKYLGKDRWNTIFITKDGSKIFSPHVQRTGEEIVERWDKIE